MGSMINEHTQHVKHLLPDVIGMRIMEGRMNPSYLLILRSKLVSVPDDVYRICRIDLRHVRHEHKLDEQSIGFDCASKPSVVFLLQEAELEKSFRFGAGSELSLDNGL